VGIPFPFGIGYPSFFIWDKRPGMRLDLGQITKGPFALQIRPNGADPFALLCTAQVEPAPGGSRVRLRFRFHPAATWLFRVGALWALIVAIAYAWQERTPRSLAAPAVVLLLAAGFLLYAQVRRRVQHRELLILRRP
jgi:hypothetical protein